MRRDDIQVKTPCGMDFAAMKAAGTTAGEIKKRFCDACKTHVHDLSKMTKGEAKELLASDATEGLCVRYMYDASGNVVFADSNARLVAAGALVRAKRFVAAAAALALPMTLNACMGAYQPKEARLMPTTQPTTQPKAADPIPSQPKAAESGKKNEKAQATPVTPPVVPVAK
jgi:hypothetical protein